MDNVQPSENNIHGKMMSYQMKIRGTREKNPEQLCKRNARSRKLKEPQGRSSS